MFFPILVIGQTITENYVKTTTYRVPTSTTPSPTALQKVVNVSYFDGLGRPIQQVAHGQSATGKDIVTPITYDAFGRQDKEYLPYVPTTMASQDYKTSALSDVATFYNTAAYENTLNPYSQKLLEASPLNRVLQQAAPGNKWALANNQTIKFDYQTNTNADAVKLFSVNDTLNATKGLYDIPTSLNPTNYDEFQLYKTITKDENWKTTDGTNNTTEEFKDKEGKVVLKRTYNSGVKHDTYYIYDQFGNLTFVLPPLVNPTATITTDVLDGLCYQYKYDIRNRLVEKKLPGKQWEFIVYDKLDRVVATGPALSPFTSPTGNGWMITKYDAFNRPILTAWQPSTTATSAGRKTLQDSYNLAATVVNETKIATATNTTVNGIAFRYTNVALPTTGYHVLTVNYYDDYNFPNSPTIPTSVEGQTVFYNVTTKPKGLPTATYVRVPETSVLYKNETSYTLYDEKARPIRNYTTNYLGGFTQVDSKLDWAGKTLYTITTHKRIASSAVITVKDAFDYTPQDRLQKHTHQINGGTVQLLAKNDYNELGQLISKNVGGTNVTGATSLQKVDYSYNIRGWLTGINKVDGTTNPLQQGTDPLDLFGFKINYDTVEGSVAGVDPLYNGNISETYWRTKSDNKLRKYGYQYDDLNRLTNAIFQNPELSIPVTNSYNESLNYDKNGNISSLQRFGDLDSEVQTIEIDNLAYTYDINKPNQLMKVLDSSNHPEGFKDDSINGVDTALDYSYDANGNMISDQNKGIITIKYNHLNLPTEIIFSGTSKKINYIYTASGVKVEKKVTNGSTITTTDYLSGYQYTKVNSGAVVMDFFPHAEGYVACTLSGSTPVYNYVFNYTDHLGNIRVSYTWNTTTSSLNILEENHYFPFGLKHTKYNRDTYEYVSTGNGGYNTGIIGRANNNRGIYQYKYNGKEYQDELGLNMYDYGARNYDPALGRWMNIDPLAEQYRRWTPYNYVMNNPLKFTDPDGMGASPVYDTDGNFLGTDEKGLQGDAWIMKKEDFKQGMSVEEAASKHLGEKALSEKAYDKAGKHWLSLPSRPDYDGYLTLSEANDWFQNGKGEPLFVDASKIDLSPVETADFSEGVGSSIYENYFLTTNQATGRVYGTIKLTLDDENGTVTLGGKDGYLDTYNFEQKKSDGSLKRELRNLGTKVGEILAGKGIEYKIFNYGKGKVEKTE